jgi:hypothetical protein
VRRKVETGHDRAAAPASGRRGTAPEARAGGPLPLPAGALRGAGGRPLCRADLLAVQRTAGNRAAAALLAARRAPAAGPRVQRHVVLEQMAGGEAAVTSLGVLKTWLARFGVLEIVERSPVRMAKLLAMFEGAAAYTFPWLLEGGDTERFLNALDGVPLFAGAEYALPLIPQHGYTFFEDMRQEAPGVFVSEARVRFVTERFTSGAISSQVLAAASDQVDIQSKSADDQRKFEWICEHLPLAMLAGPLTRENLSLLMALQTKLGVTPTPALLALVMHCGADIPLRGLLFEYLQLQIGLDVLTTELLDLLKPFAGQLIRHPDALTRAHAAALAEPGKLAEYAPFGFNREGYAKAHAYGAGQAKHYRATETKALTQSVASQEAAAIAAQEQAATVALTKNQKKDLTKLPTSEPYQKAKQALEAKKRELAQGDLATIEQGRQQREGQIAGEAATTGQAAVVEYRDFLNDGQVRHHPLAIAALELGKHDFAFATKLVSALWQKPAIAPLVTQATLSAAEIDRCLSDLSLDALAALLGSIQQAVLKIYAATTTRLVALARLQQDGVTGSRLADLSADIKVFDPYLASASVPALSALLGTRGYLVADVQECLARVPTDDRGRPAGALLVQTIAGHAAGAADVLECLALAERLHWKSAPIVAALNGVGQGLAGAALRDAMYLHAVDSRPNDSLRSWLDALDVPVTDGWATIAVGGKEDLGIGAKGYRTYEWECTVRMTQGAQVLLTFVIHSHPGAKVTIDNKFGSDKHVKPSRADTETRLPFNNSLGKGIFKAIS